ncbi:MAG: hypothetical protein IJ453_04440 [Oscillospiraceae bacterium]|nr:hypothetical protein [Oscillospiraceae bacterium]
MEQEIQLLRSIYRQSRRGMRSVDRLQRSCSDPGSARLFHQQWEEYALIAQTADRFLQQRGYTAPMTSVMPLGGKRDPLSLLADSTRQRNRQLCTVKQTLPTDPKVAALNRRLLMACQAELETINMLL